MPPKHKKYKQIHVDKLMKNGGKGGMSLPTPEAPQQSASELI